MKLKYIVKIDYYTKFEFDNGTTALGFAELAKRYGKEGTTVEIEVTEDDF